MASRPTKSRLRKKAKSAAAKRPTKKQLLMVLKAAGKPASSKLTNEQLIRKIAAIKAKQTKERKREIHEKRSIAARQGWQTRKQKSPELRKWETERRRIQYAQLQAIEEGRKLHKWPSDFIRFGNLVYFPVTDLPISAIHSFLVALKKRGVPVFRMEREVPVGEYDRTTETQVTRAGYRSTNWIFMGTLDEVQLSNGNIQRNWPSLKSMRVPGIDIMRWLVLRQEDIALLPQAVRVAIRQAPIETRERMSDDEQTFYLTHKRKPTKRELSRLRKQREQLEQDLDEEGEE